MWVLVGKLRNNFKVTTDSINIGMSYEHDSS